MSKTTHDSDVAFIQALAELLAENELTELRVKREYADADSLDVRVSRIQPQAAPAPVAAAPAPTAQATQTQVEVSTPAGDPADDPSAITSPMVGTVYMQSEPGAPAFVTAGQQVAEGDTLVIIEAMKTMNHIPAPRAGTVKRVLVDDGVAVEYGAPLVILE